MIKEPKSSSDDFGNVFWRSSSWDLHRIDGPAVERQDGIKEWWVAGAYVGVSSSKILIQDDYRREIARWICYEEE